MPTIPAEVQELLNELGRTPDEALRTFAAGSRFANRPRKVGKAKLALRELEERHAEYVSYLLGSFGQRLQYLHPVRSKLLSRTVRVGEPLQLRSTEELIEGARSLVSLEQPLDDESHFLLQAIGDGSFSKIDPLDCALVAWRLLPQQHVTFVASVEYATRMEWRMAERFLSSVLQCSSTQLLESYAWENLAWLRIRQGRPDLALDFIKKAASADGRRPTPLYAWIALAADLDLREELAAVAREVDDLVVGHDQSVDAFISSLQEYSRQGIYRPRTRGSLPDASEADSASRRIYNAIY